jgi:predicted dehydrogenase
MSSRLKVAVVGASISNSPDGRERFAIRAHLPALKHLSEEYDVVAVCTTRMETATETARRFDIPYAFDNVERMLSEMPEIDVVCVAVRPAIHHKVVMAALRAGKHVYCEQPLGVTTSQAKEMYDLAREKGVRTVVGHQHHYDPAALQMADMVRHGYIGKPLAFSSSNFGPNHIAPRPSHRVWLFQQEACGHPGFRSMHSLQRVIGVLGDVREICADMRVLVPERPNLDGGEPLKTTQVNNLNFLMRVGDDVMGTLQVSLTAWFGTGWIFQAYGTEGMLMVKVEDNPNREKISVKGDPRSGELKLYGARIDLPKYIANPVAPELLQREFQEIPLEAKHFYVTGIEESRATFPVAQMWYAFAKAIQSGGECTPNFRDELKMHCVMDATELSMHDRRWVTVDYSLIGEELSPAGSEAGLCCPGLN